ESFRMRWKRGMRDLRKLWRRKDGDAAVAIADEDAVVAWIDAHVVGVVAEIDHRARPKIAAVVTPDNAVAAAGDDHPVVEAVVGDALRLIESRNAMHDLPCRQIDDVDGSVTQF